MEMKNLIHFPPQFKLKPILMRAFTAAKNLVNSAKAKTYDEDDFVSKGEFRLLLKYLKIYFEIWVAFDCIDTGDDRKINY
jgi:hypothetical protein